jgi:hypothetical protein
MEERVAFQSDTEIGFPQALQKDMRFVDLLTGNAYLVLSIHKAKENDRHNLEMPGDVVQTISAGSLPLAQLESMREKCKIKVGENLKPRREFAVLT